MGEDTIIARWRAPGGDPRERARSMERGGARAERPTVLIVDDEGMTRGMLAELLEGVGYRVLLADDGQMALALAECERPSLVLTDCSMPRLDGPELIRRLRAIPETRHIPVVAMSAARPRADILRTVPFIEKPFDLDDVLEIVARYTPGPPADSRAEVAAPG